jgi:hypothetical protein
MTIKKSLLFSFSVVFINTSIFASSLEESQFFKGEDKLATSINYESEIREVPLDNPFQVHQNIQDYYTNQLINFNSLSSIQLRAYLKSIISFPHLKHENAPDQLIYSCSLDSPSCVPVVSYTYVEARKILFGEIHLEHNSNGEKIIEPLYCGGDVTHSAIQYHSIPYGSGLNCEHIWPKSRFGASKNTPLYSTMVSDLHHLYPTYSTVNSQRGNNRFGHPSKPQKVKSCPNNQIGPGEYGMLFLPRQEVRGDVARASFYFAIRYGVSIDDREERVLREWHAQDPVSQFEIEKNNLVYKYQGNRNPLIDFPTLADKIQDF